MDKLLIHMTSDDLRQIIKEEMGAAKSVIDIDECSNLTGLAKSTLRKHMSVKGGMGIPYWKTGGKVYFEKSEVEAWLRRGK